MNASVLLSSNMPFMAASTSFRTLSTEEDLENAFARSEREPVLLFKHSSRCSLSARAYREMQRLDDAEDPPVYHLTVQEARDLSNAVEERLGIRHETPQAILLSKEKALFDASHHDVTAQNVREAAKGARI